MLMLRLGARKIGFVVFFFCRAKFVHCETTLKEHLKLDFSCGIQHVNIFIMLTER